MNSHTHFMTWQKRRREREKKIEHDEHCTTMYMYECNDFDVMVRNWLTVEKRTQFLVFYSFPQSARDHEYKKERESRREKSGGEKMS